MEKKIIAAALIDLSGSLIVGAGTAPADDLSQQCTNKINSIGARTGVCPPPITAISRNN